MISHFKISQLIVGFEVEMIGIIIGAMRSKLRIGIIKNSNPIEGPCNIFGVLFI